MHLPYLDVNLDAIENNARTFCGICRESGIQVAGVIKFSDGDTRIAKAYAAGGCAQIAVSRAAHLEAIKQALPGVQTMLTRSPSVDDMEQAARFCDIALMADADSLRLLDEAAARAGTCPGVLLMLDTGDLREGAADPEELCALAVLAEQAAPQRAPRSPIWNCTGCTCSNSSSKTRR